MPIRSRGLSSYVATAPRAHPKHDKVKCNPSSKNLILIPSSSCSPFTAAQGTWGKWGAQTPPQSFASEGMAGAMAILTAEDAGNVL